MEQLVQVSENCFYIPSHAKVGVVKCGEDEVCLIDSGTDEETGRRIFQILQKQGWRLKAIYNTHANADHIGGNHYLQSRTGCKIYAPGMERDFARHPLLNPAFLYGGFPYRELHHKILYPQASQVEELTEQVLPQGWQIIPLPGHFFEMVGFRTPDDVVYLADSLCSDKMLEKYNITFVFDVAMYLATLEKVKTMKAKCFVPSHVDATDDLSELAQRNIDKVHEIAGHILRICREPKNFDVILQQLFSIYDRRMNPVQHALVGCTVRSYLSWLKEAGQLRVKFEDNMMLWQHRQ